MNNEKKKYKAGQILDGYTKKELVDFLLDVLPFSAIDEIITNYDSQNPDST